MSEYNVLKAMGKPAGQDAILELTDANGDKWAIAFKTTGIEFRRGSTVVGKFSSDGALSNISLGEPTVVTIASGVATITAGTTFVALAAESSTSDQLDTITVTGAKQGDLLYLCADAGDTITVDDANIDLGNTTRVLVGMSQFLVLMFNGTGWSEVSFAAGDNS